MSRPFSIVIWLTLGAIAVAGVATGIEAMRRDTLSVSNSTPNSAPIIANVDPTAPQSLRKLEVEIVTIQSTGFDPSEIKRPAGPFSLHVNNRSEIPELQLRLDRDRAERLQTAPLLRGRLDWKRTIDLPPGRYVLTEAQHPEWVCRITITPQ